MRGKQRKKAEQMSNFATSAHAYYSPFEGLMHYAPLQSGEERLYEMLKEGVPVIGAAISKIIHLIGGFQIKCEDEELEEEFNEFLSEVKVGRSSQGIHQFLSVYMEDLLTYGNAAAEIVLQKDKEGIYALYNIPLEKLTVRKRPNSLEIDFFSLGKKGEMQRLKYPQLLLFSALKPDSGEIKGNSILKGLPFVAGILLKIYESIGNNFERIGNLRYAISYKPDDQSVGEETGKNRAQQIAQEWTSAMHATRHGEIRDFVSVGDVDIQVIGADNQFIDTNIPVRQMLEQIISKLCIPPFLLGVQWSTTETMSKQQTEILTSELAYFRGLLTPIIKRICAVYCAVQGKGCVCQVKWNPIKLQDEIELAKHNLN